MSNMVSRNVSSMVDGASAYLGIIRQVEFLRRLKQIGEMDSVKEKRGCLKIGPVVI